MPDRPEIKPPLEPAASISARAAAGASGQRLLAGRFEVLRWLGEGGMGTVYLARDRKLDRRVAVKVLLAGNDAESLARFKQEFRSLAGISHPNLVVLHELLADEGTWLFTMDYVEGRDFLAHVSTAETRDAAEVDARRRGPALPRCPVRDEAVLRRVLAQLADAVRALHAAGKLHLGLKPCNVLVGSNDHVTVLDYGLARDLRQNSPLWTQRLLGTPAYIAPEHAESGRLAPAGDWYAVGVMLYEALCGRLPFEGPVAHMLLAKTTGDPEPPSRYARDVPRDLERLCMDLLGRDPAKRPGGAEILERLGSQAPISQVQAAPTPSEPLVGRTRALAELHRRDSHPGEARIVLVRGPAGVGKSALAQRYLEEVATRTRETGGSTARERGTLVLRSACHAREATPFNAFDGIVEGLLAHLHKLPPSEVSALLPRHAHALARLFPAFASLPALPVPRRIDEDEPAAGRARAFSAFAELFERLARRIDVVLFIDDLQFGDRDSAQLMLALFKLSEPVPLTLLGTHRGDDADSPLLNALRDLSRAVPKPMLEEAEVGPLDDGDARALAEALLRNEGVHDPALAEHLAREAQGMPLFLSELARHAAKDPAARRKVSLDQVLSERIGALAEPARKLLEVLAVAGGPLPRAVAFRAALLRQGQDSALHTLRATGLARGLGGAQERIDVAHERAREAVRTRLPAEVMARTHARLLEAFESEPNPDDARLFVHSMGAGMHARALAYAERAGSHAQEVLAFHRAIELYRTALSLLARERPSDGAHRGRLLAQLGNALAADGHCLEAASSFLEAAKLGAPEDLPVFERKAADQLLRGGDVRAGGAMLARVLERVGVSYPRTPRTALAGLTYERARLFARGLGFEERPPESVSSATHALLDSLKVALGAYWLLEPVRGALFASQYLRHALEVGHVRHVRRGLEIEAAYVALTGGAKGEQRAGELYASARSLTQQVGSASSRAANLIADAGFHAIYGRKQKSTECALEALRAPTTQSAGWERTYARFHLYQNALYLGARPDFAQEVAGLVSDAELRRDQFSAATLLPMLALAQLMADAPLEADAALARLRVHLNPEMFGFLDVQEMIYTALTQLYRGDVAGALSTYASRGESYQQSGIPRLSTWRMLHLRGMLLAHLGAAEAGLDAARNLEEAEDRIKQMEREKIAWAQPFVHAGRAALLHARGQTTDRDAALQQAVGSAKELGYPAFALLFALAALRLRAGHHRDELRRLEQELNALGVASPSRWRRLWAPGLG